MDIETSGPAWAEIDEPTREYLEERALSDAQRKGEKLDYEQAESAAQDHVALDLGLARIIGIGMLAMHTDEPYIILNAPSQTVVEEQGLTVACFRDEAAMLSRFWHVLERRSVGRVITFNGRTFDGPNLMVRSAMMNIPVGRNLVGYRYDIQDACDLYDVLTFFGAARGYSLSYWSRRFGIADPKAEGVTGANVGRLHAEGRFNEMARYMGRDLRSTGELYTRMIPMLWSFKGGPPLQPYQKPSNIAQELFG